MKRSTTTASARRVHYGHHSSGYTHARQCLALVIVMLVLQHIPILRAQQPKASEYQVKATYLYNFGRFVQWPPNVAAAQGDSFPICVIGSDPFGTSLDSILAGETIEGKTVVAKRILKSQDAVNCRVLYIGASEESRLKDLLAALDKAGVLTVSDIPQFSQRGGMIQFVMVGNKVRFEVNLTSAQDAGLTLSSDLLKVAAAVRKNPLPGD
jgi:hypothetical protein